MSLRECAFADAERYGAGAVSELKEKYKKRDRVNRIARRGNTAKRDARSQAANEGPKRA